MPAMVGGFGNIKINHLNLIKSLFEPRFWIQRYNTKKVKVYQKKLKIIVAQHSQLQIDRGCNLYWGSSLHSVISFLLKEIGTEPVGFPPLPPQYKSSSRVTLPLCTCAIKPLYLFDWPRPRGEAGFILSKSNSSKIYGPYSFPSVLGPVDCRGEVEYTEIETSHLLNFKSLSSAINKSQSRSFGLLIKKLATPLNSSNLRPSKLLLSYPNFTSGIATTTDVLFQLEGLRQYHTKGSNNITRVELLKSNSALCALEESLNKISGEPTSYSPKGTQLGLCAVRPVTPQTEVNTPIELGPYLAGLIEGDGTFAVHDKKSTAKKYSPMIIIVFKKSDLPFAKFLCELTNCGKVYQKPERGYILWQIQELVGVFTILKLINGKMRTPKIEALDRAIKWFNSYIDKNKDSKLPSTKQILNKIHKLETLPLDLSLLETSSWLSGFIDADGNFSINIHKRTNKNSTRVQLYFRIEIRQNYHRNPSSIELIDHNSSYFPIMSNIANFMGVTIYSRSRELKGKVYFSYTVVCHNKLSIFKLISYIDKFPLLSSKFLDFIDFKTVYLLQQQNSLTTSYLDKASKIRKDFNSTRTTYSWNHLKNCYISISAEAKKD